MNIWQRWWSAQSLFHTDERKQHTEYVKPLSRPIRPIHTFSTASLQWMSHRCFNTILKTSHSMECRTQPSLMWEVSLQMSRTKRKEIIFLITGCAQQRISSWKKNSEMWVLHSGAGMLIEADYIYLFLQSKAQNLTVWPGTIIQFTQFINRHTSEVKHGKWLIPPTQN